ncbi:MAG: hypothetical protein AB7K41_09485 [Bdellovibrionales bacterium]
MYSDIKMTLVGLIAAIFLLGCAGENEFSTVPPDVKFDSPKFQCLSKADEVLTDYLNGNLTNSEVQSFWNCLDMAVVQFVKFVRGSEGQNYKPQEMAKFLDTYFLDNRGLAQHSELLAEFMEIKRLFVGGSLERVSHTDLYYRTRELLMEFKSITMELNPHMKTLHLGLSGENSKALLGSEVEAATLALQRAGERLGHLFKKGNYFYSFSHLQALLTELEKFVQKTSPDFTLANTRKYIPLFSEFKNLVVAPPYDLIRNEDWNRLLESMSSILGWIVQYRFYIEDEDWGQGDSFEALSRIARGALSELEKGLDKQDKKEFSFIDLDRLVVQLDELDLLPLDFDAETGKSILRRLGERVLAPQSEVGTGLNQADLVALRQEVLRWIEAQHFLNQVAKDSMPVFEETFSSEQMSVEAQDAAPDPAAEMRMLMRTRWPLLHDNKNRLVFSAATFAGQYDQGSLSTLNWQRALMRALMRGYAKQTSPDGATGLSGDELSVLLQDWHVLAEKMGLFEPGEAESMAKKIFMEANLFMPSSNGDERIDFIEAVQYMAYAISGLNSAGDIVDTIEEQCQDAIDKKKVVAACLRSQLYGQRHSFLGNFPFLLQFVGENEARWRQFANMIENTTRNGVSDKPFSKGDIVEMIVLLHYIETFYGTYDGNKNQLINVDETLNAFPVFRRSLNEIVKNSFGITMSGDDLKGLLTYLFNFGKPPQSTFGGVLKFLNWRWTPEAWNYDVDRLRVIQILAELNASR